MRVLYVGDVVGKPGRRLVHELVPSLRVELELDAVVINGENAAGGIGLTPEIAHNLLEGDADLLTTGNHVWKKRELVDYLEGEARIVRPANYPPPCPGRDMTVLDTPAGSLALIQVEGRVFMRNLMCPFRTVDQLLQRPECSEVDAILVDIHAEATSEKQGLGWYLDGRVAAVVGTHTHVATADERILPKGTGYISDVGMTGPHDSVIGMKIDQSLTRMLTQRPLPHSVATGNLILNAVLLVLEQGKTVHIERVRRVLDAV